MRAPRDLGLRALSRLWEGWAFALRARCVVFASKARYGQGPAASRVLRCGVLQWDVLQWGVVRRISGVPQRGTAYQPRVKPWVRDTPTDAF